MRHWLCVCISTLLTVPFPTSGFLPRQIKNVPEFLQSSGGRDVRQSDGWTLSMQQNATQPSNYNKHLPQFPLGFKLKMDQGQLLCDMFAILIASQMIGLLDVVNDAEFVRNGGWLQPIPAVPSTFGSLVRRIALLSCLWFPLSLLRVTGKKDDKDVDFQDGMADTLYSVLLFTTIRLGLTFFMHEIPLQEMELLNALRDCYMVALTTTSFRYLYRQYLS